MCPRRPWEPFPGSESWRNRHRIVPQPHLGLPPEVVPPEVPHLFLGIGDIHDYQSHCGAIGDCHANNAQAIVAFLVNNFPTRVQEFVGDFINTYPWRLTTDLAAFAQAQMNVRLFVAPAFRTEQEADAGHIPIHLLMTVDGPETPNLLVWGARFGDIEVGVETSAQHQGLPGLLDHYVAGMQHLEDMEQFGMTYSDGKDYDSWALGHCREVVFNAEVIDEALIVNQVWVRRERQLGYVGLRPTAFDKPLNFQTTKGQAARAAREVLRHIILHCQTNLSTLYESYHETPVLPYSPLDVPFRSVSPHPYLAHRPREEFAFIADGLAELTEPMYGADDEILDLMRLPFIWPAGWDGYRTAEGPPSERYDEYRHVEMKLDVDPLAPMSQNQPPGQFHPVYNDSFAAPLDCALVYRMYVEFWLTAFDLQSAPNTTVATQRFFAGFEAGWLWDQNVDEGALAQPGYFKFFHSLSNNLWNKLNDIPDEWAGSPAVGIEEPKRHQRLAVEIVHTHGGGISVRANTGDAAVCFDFGTNVDAPCTFEPTAVEIAPEINVPVPVPVCGQANSVSPFAWPAQLGEIPISFSPWNEKWMMSSNVQGNVYSCDEVVFDQYDGFDFRPDQLP